MNAAFSASRSSAFRFAASVALLVVALGVAAEERYIVPVFVMVDGAFGSRFTSELQVMNVSDTAQVVRGIRAGCPILCPHTPLAFGAFPNDVVSFFERTGLPGVILKAADGAALRMNLRVRDLSRADLSAGTEVPIIHESRLQRGVVHILGVPAEGARFRNRLRVYAFAPATVRVRFIGEGGDVVLEESTLELKFPTPEIPTDVEFYPAFAETADFPDGRAVRLQIEPLSGADRVWAFVTTTNNVTQEITVVTPQP